MKSLIESNAKHSYIGSHMVSKRRDIGLLHLTVSEMAGHKIVRATSKGLSVIKEICLEAALRLGIGGL
ncbi:hypothetical protein CUMW_064910 [Citrus unshiu]|nr:hypothetical protein CUMW_064910 [Citrus unshiu]